MKSKTTIELNGVRYDAATGKVLGSAVPASTKSGRNIDGFFRSRTTAPLTTKGKTVSPPAHTAIGILAPVPHPPKNQSRMPDHISEKLAVHRSPVAANHTKHHRTEHSKTLMRNAVTRPVPSLHKQLGTKGTLQHAVPSLLVPKKSVASLDDARLARAQTTARSPLVAHHTSQMPQKIHPLLASLSVQPVPEPTAVPPTIAPAPEPPSNKPTDIFEHALANATNFVDTQAQRAHFRKHARRHITSMAAGTLALLVIAGFAAYQNTPGLQFKVASLQAGVATAMPDLKAAGFAYNGAAAKNGKLVVGFTDHTAQFQLTQQATNFSSSDMIQNIGATDASGTPNYSVVKAGGTDVYRFDNTNATWVKNGTWYTVTGTGALSDKQVQALAQHV